MRNIVAIAAAFAPAVVLACHPQMERRAINAARQLDRSNEAAEAQITDKQEECSYYNYEPVNGIINSYPDIWKTADLSASGIQQSDRDLFASINASIPDIPVRGNRYGDFTGIVYNTTGDPDCWWSATHCVTPAASSGLHNDTIDCNEANTWGFTLDDGPNCSHNAFYDYLQARKQKATLFYIGSNVLDWPLEAQRGLADGHEICAHTWSHHMTGLTNEEVFSELYFSKKAIKEVLGVTVRCWRPPYGDVDNRVRYIADKLDMRTVVWNQDTDDWNWSNVGMAAIRQNYQGILGRQTAGKFNHSGTIVLTHELDNGTMSLVEEFLPQIQQQFVGGVMPVAVCLNNSRPYIEQADYLYPNYDQWMSGTTSMSLAAPTATSIASLALSPTAMPTSSAASSSTTAASSGAAASSAARALVSTGSRVSGSQASSTAGATHKSGARVRFVAHLSAVVAAVGIAAYSLT